MCYLTRASRHDRAESAGYTMAALSGSSSATPNPSPGPNPGAQRPPSSPTPGVQQPPSSPTPGAQQPPSSPTPSAPAQLTIGAGSTLRLSSASSASSYSLTVDSASVSCTFPDGSTGLCLSVTSAQVPDHPAGPWCSGGNWNNTVADFGSIAVDCNCACAAAECRRELLPFPQIAEDC